MHINNFKKYLLIGLLAGGASAIHRIHKDIEKGIERTLTGWGAIVFLHVGGFVLLVFFIVLIDFIGKKQNKTDT